jgi:hypothetical protein
MITLKVIAEEKIYRCKGHTIFTGIELDTTECVIKVNDMNNIYKNTFIHSCLSGSESKTEYSEFDDVKMKSHASVSITSNFVHVESVFKIPNKENLDSIEFIDFDQISKKYNGIGKGPFGSYKFYGICD